MPLLFGWLNIRPSEEAPAHRSANKPRTERHDRQDIGAPSAFFDAYRKAVARTPVDIEGFAARMGVELVPTDMPDDMAGWMFERGRAWHVHYNAAHPVSRQRFTIAYFMGMHHYARMAMGKDRSHPGTNASISYRQVMEAPFYNPVMPSSESREALRFACNLVMPADPIRRMVAEGLTVFQIADRMKTTVEAMNIRIRGLSVEE